MAYNPRYMRPFVGTTIVIQDDAITPDKLDDKAVEEKHLGDDVVSERALGSSSVATSEIKDGEVKTVDIGDGQVTNPKLADGVITEDKLAFTPSTRPLTPGVDTPEIQDSKITLVKLASDSVDASKIKAGAVGASELAGDAVETVKIKDDAVDGDKIAESSIGNEHIKADAVRGTEIQDGAVSAGKLGTDSVVTLKLIDDAVSSAKIQASAVTTVKIAPLNVTATRLAADAVETAKIKDLNVTEPKLEFDILHKLLDSSQLFYDDFVGATLRPEWASSGDPGGSISRANSELTIRTNGVDDEKFRANFGADFPFSQGDKPRVFVRSKVNDTLIHVRFGLYKDDNNYILFDFDTDVDANWHVKTKKLGVETDIDTGVAASFVMHEFFFEVVSAARVEFFIDGALEGTSLTNIPLSELQPWLEVQTRVNAVRLLASDKFLVSTDQSVGAPPP